MCHPHPVVLINSSGLQGEQPLFDWNNLGKGSRKMDPVTSEKGMARGLVRWALPSFVPKARFGGSIRAEEHCQWWGVWLVAAHLLKDNACSPKMSSTRTEISCGTKGLKARLILISSTNTNRESGPNDPLDLEFELEESEKLPQDKLACAAKRFIATLLY
ncbi:hypothetical protein Tco_1069641 [Tanacetum coccineum]|uniref:Uncharacterized protein n=1 Tax=Tanacetum coccineum TaxID=301880 RepID=A0ABQ5HJF1_9ASTR